MDLLGKRSEKNKFLNIEEFGGQLYIVRVLMYYDYPRFFVCQNENDELYLFNETRDEKELEAWGVIKIDYDNLIKFYKNELSFRDLYIIYADSYWDVTLLYLKNGSEEKSIIKTEPAELLEFYSDDKKLYYDAAETDMWHDLYDDIGEN